jgi:hypothetical protein
MQGQGFLILNKVKDDKAMPGQDKTWLEVKIASLELGDLFLETRLPQLFF